MPKYTEIFKKSKVQREFYSFQRFFFELWNYFAYLPLFTKKKEKMKALITQLENSPKVQTQQEGIYWTDCKEIAAKCKEQGLQVNDLAGCRGYSAYIFTK